VIHLDTSFLVQAIAGVAACERPVRRWLEEGEELAMSAVAWAEFLRGPLGPAEHQLAIRFITLHRGRKLVGVRPAADGRRPLGTRPFVRGRPAWRPPASLTGFPRSTTL
jgi:hypothetical protein